MPRIGECIQPSTCRYERRHAGGDRRACRGGIPESEHGLTRRRKRPSEHRSEAQHEHAAAEDDSRFRKTDRDAAVKASAVSRFAEHEDAVKKRVQHERGRKQAHRRRVRPAPAEENAETERPEHSNYAEPVVPSHRLLARDESDEVRPHGDARNAADHCDGPPMSRQVGSRYTGWLSLHQSAVFSARPQYHAAQRSNRFASNGNGELKLREYRRRVLG